MAGLNIAPAKERMELLMVRPSAPASLATVATSTRSQSLGVSLTVNGTLATDLPASICRFSKDGFLPMCMPTVDAGMGQETFSSNRSTMPVFWISSTRRAVSSGSGMARMLMCMVAPLFLAISSSRSIHTSRVMVENSSMLTWPMGLPL